MIERIAFEARDDKRIDKRSGVSQRMPITVMENVVSNAERRAIVDGRARRSCRASRDIYAALPAITGKIELEYEGELVGGHAIARELIRRAADATFQERAGGVNTDDIIMWFDEGGALQVTDDARADAVLKGFEVVPGLLDARASRRARAGRRSRRTSVAACELVLEALVARKKISRSDGGQYGRAEPERAAPAEAGSLRRRPVRLDDDRRPPRRARVHGEVRRGDARRPATPRDLDAVVALRLALLREHPDHPIYGRLRPDVDRRARDLFAAQLALATETIFLAELGGRGRRHPALRRVDGLAAARPGALRLRLVRRTCAPRRGDAACCARSCARRSDGADARGLERDAAAQRRAASVAAERAWDALGFEVVEQVRGARRAASPTR